MPTILAVDDSTSIRLIIRSTLTRAGYEVIEAKDGVEAFEVATTRPANLVLTDGNMPNMDGVTLIGKLRTLPHYRLTPMILLTGDAGPEVIKASKSAGATGWLTKPLKPKALLRRVQHVLG